jgi:hypothetical protein
VQLSTAILLKLQQRAMHLPSSQSFPFGRSYHHYLNLLSAVVIERARAAMTSVPIRMRIQVFLMVRHVPRREIRHATQSSSTRTAQWTRALSLHSLAQAIGSQRRSSPAFLATILVSNLIAHAWKTPSIRSRPMASSGGRRKCRMTRNSNVCSIV